MIDFDEIINHESVKLETAQDMEFKFAKREANYMKLKQKIIATASVIKSYKSCKIQCQEKDNEINSLKNENTLLRNDYKKALVEHMALEKNYEELVRKFDYLKEQNGTLDIKEKSTQALNKQLQNLLLVTEEKLENSEKQVENKKLENELMKIENKECNVQLKKNTLIYQKQVNSLYKSLFKFGDKAFSSGILTKEEKVLLRKCRNHAKSDGVVVEDLDDALHINLELDDILEETGRAGPLSCASTDTGWGSASYTSDDGRYPSAATTPTRDPCFSPGYNDCNSTCDIFGQSDQKRLNINDMFSRNISNCIVATDTIKDSKSVKTTPSKIMKSKSISPKKRSLISNKAVVPKIIEIDSVNLQVKNILDEMKSSVNLISPIPSSDEDLKNDSSTSNLRNPLQIKSKRILRQRYRPAKHTLVRKSNKKRLMGITSYLLALTKKIAKEEVNKALQTPTPSSAESNQQKPVATLPETHTNNSHPVVIIQGLNSMNQVSVPRGPGVYIINNIPALTHQLPASTDQLTATTQNLSTSAHLVSTIIDNSVQQSQVNLPSKEPESLNNDEQSSVSVDVGKTQTFDKSITDENTTVKTVEKQTSSPSWTAKEINSDLPVHAVSPVRRNPRRVTSSSPLSGINVDKKYEDIHNLKSKNNSTNSLIQKKIHRLFESEDNSFDDILNTDRKRKRRDNKSVSTRKKQKPPSACIVSETLQDDNNVDRSDRKDINHSHDANYINNASIPQNKNLPDYQSRPICDKKEEAKLLLANYYKKKETSTPIFINRKVMTRRSAKAPNFDEIMQNMNISSGQMKAGNEIHDIQQNTTSLDLEEPVETSSKALPQIDDGKLIHHQSKSSEKIPVDDIDDIPVNLQSNSENGTCELQRNLIVHDYNMFETAAGSLKEQDERIFVSIIKNNMRFKKSKFNKPEKPNDHLYNQLEKYLLNGFSKARLDSLLEIISKEKEKSVARAMVDFLSQERDKDNILIRQPPISPMNSYQLSVLSCINRIHTDPPSHFKHDIFDLVMRGIEHRSFVLGNVSPSVRSLSNMATFYAALCRITKQKDKLKLFCMDAMYCYSYKSTPIIYAVLQSWHQLFPKSHFNVAKDPLLVVMMHCLQTNFSEKIEYQCQNMQRLLSTKYGFKPGEYNDDGVVKYLIDAVKGLKSNAPTRNLHAAFLLLGKRFDVENCHKKIIIRSLLPILDDSKSKVESRAFVAGLLGPLVRPFPASMMMECEVFVKKLSVMLGNRDSPLVEEALASSLTYLSKKNFNMAVRTLVKWQPKTPISEHARNLMTLLIWEKPFSYWNSILNSA